MSSSKGNALSLWVIVVIAVVGGLLVISVTASLIVRRIRQRRISLGEADDFPPFHRLAVRRGQIVRASWNLSLGASILGSKADNASFMSLDDKLTGGRRSRRGVARSRASHRSSLNSQLSRPTTSEMRKTPKAEYQLRPKSNLIENVRSIDDELSEKHHIPVNTQSSTAQSAYTITSTELSEDRDTASGDPSMTEKHEHIHEILTDKTLVIQSPQGTLQSPTPSRKRHLSIPISKYAPSLALTRKSFQSSQTSLHRSMVPNLAPVVEGTSTIKPSGLGGPEAAESSTDNSKPRGLRHTLTPLAVPAPVLSTTDNPPTLSPQSSSLVLPAQYSSFLSEENAHWPSQSTRHHQQQHRISNILSSSATPNLQLKTTANSPLPPSLTNPRPPPPPPKSSLMEGSDNNHSRSHSASTLINTAENLSLSSSKKKTASPPSTTGSNMGRQPVDDKTGNAADRGRSESSRQGSKFEQSQDLRRTPSKKGNVLRKKSLVREARTQQED